MTKAKEEILFIAEHHSIYYGRQLSKVISFLIQLTRGEIMGEKASFPILPAMMPRWDTGLILQRATTCY